MSEKTPEHRDELSPWRRGEDSLFESIGDMMREVPPPPPPPDTHLAMLNRRVRDHIEQDRGVRRALDQDHVHRVVRVHPLHRLEDRAR